MALSNTATPIYYGRFREAVMRGEIPVCREISMEMNRIDDLIANPGIYYDDKAVNGFIAFCEEELTAGSTSIQKNRRLVLWIISIVANPTIYYDVLCAHLCVGWALIFIGRCL